MRFVARPALVALLTVALTLGTVLPLVAWDPLDPSYAVTAGAVALSGARLDRRGTAPLARLLRVPVVVVVLACVGFLLTHLEPVGDAVVVTVYGLAIVSRRFPPPVAAAGRAALLPLLAMFMTPVPVGDRPVVSLLLITAICLVAAFWSLVAERLVGEAPPPSRLRTLVAAARRGSPAAHAAAREVDATMAPDAPGRADVVRVQVAVDGGHDVEPPLAALAGSYSPGPAPPPQPRRPPSARAVDSLALQGAVALALGLVAGQVLFPAHWPWTAVTVLTMTVSARARGDVLYRGLERLGGAAAGTVLSALVAEAVGGHRSLGIGSLLVVFALAVLLRDVGYVWWALLLTTTLGLLYGVLGAESGVSVLAERLLAVLVGAVCAVVPAFVIRPIRSRQLVKRRAADWLAAVRSLLDDDASDPVVSRLRAVEAATDVLRDSVVPLRLANRLWRRHFAVPLGWSEVACEALPAARRTALDDGSAATELRHAYARVGRSVRET
ncbi:FUSC family protein [Spongisporangium articulatum]|uniref:FUSC family protein n=1 Tax=Spongisporangium articulatum TaxID=3362603 RepID=A0ABW8AQ25_9ACTN